MLPLATALCFFLLVAGLLAVDLVSWKRTASIRRSTIPHWADTPKAGSFRTSRTTLFAALAGVAAAAWGVAAAERGGIGSLVLVACGTFISVAGLVARVTEVRVGDDAFVVLFAGRSPFHARWAEILRLNPPGTPVGGWRLFAAGGKGTTLMPSDLFGHEEFLALIVDRSDLWFDGRGWVRNGGREAS